MRRREFITLLGGAAAAWPLAARAQQGDRMRRIGVLIGLAEDDPETKARLAGFRQGLEKELVALQPDVILANSTPAIAALQRESRAIPVVFAGAADPIGSGFVA